MEKDTCKPLVVKQLFSYEITVPHETLDKYCEKLGIINLKINIKLSPDDCQKIMELYTKENFPDLIDVLGMEIDNVAAPFNVCNKNGVTDKVAVVIISDCDNITIKVAVYLKMNMNIALEYDFSNDQLIFNCKNPLLMSGIVATTSGKTFYDAIKEMFESELAEVMHDINYRGPIELKPLDKIIINGGPLPRAECSSKAA